ncbi:EAL and HDOD domain-containing protein [Bacillus haynesii]|uniref:EAL and HDOD domain-containing protein n=1 Tax=Bacillus haynesii TaxID=1925021 RepID=UPI00227F2EA8|nr:HDOD domain-containing protein [Bacillus haynesii]MCY7768554.1 HDOD domain-containing protein [Bacillus haynesii]MCY8013389.1 HDOD domain-containing protein [Bacillus haynesii]MCY8076603.1 HDOD domain-containing protein [Bacillus haynesii]MEC0718899.1 HDOD domain-containing protein [Bacillus haynesii]MEC0763832.1 HDOD domain-containing protein [Bacillus haynesii]
MRVFVARQPIFNRKEQVVAYELLYRESEKNFFSGIDGDQATTELMINSFLNIGIDKLTEGKRYYVNFTEGLLTSGLPTYFDPDQLVVEILEDVPITPGLIERCRHLKSLGYTIALDDFCLKHRVKRDLLHQLLASIDILKIDFFKTTRQERQSILRSCRNHRLTFLAEKVETRKDYEQAAKDGFHLFQGYFFSEPVVIDGQDITYHFHAYYELLHELSEDQPDIENVTNIIERDLSLSYQLLKLLNSPANRPIQKIKSIRQAIVLLGFKEIKRWIFILSFKDLTKKQNSSKNEVVKISLIRAKLCELLAKKTNRPQPASYMLTGMFSFIDTLLHKELTEVISELPLTDEVGQALLGKENDYRKILRLAKSIERNEWEDTAETEGLTKDEAYQCYLEAVDWCQKLL